MSSAPMQTAVLLRSEQTDGVVSLIRSFMSAGPPLYHHDFDEAFTSSTES